MLSPETNQLLTQTGPGTPGGTLLRRYWHPIAPAVELDANPVKKVRLLCEDLVLYRDRSGTLGLIDEPCPHRRVSMEYGIPEQVGLRCPYHGWLFDHTGRCTEQPAEPWNSTFKDRVTTRAYRVEELGGLIFAYLGPEPAPLLPRYDLLVWDNVMRHIGVTMIPCNWVQCMENSMDPVHVEWLHGLYLDYVWARKGQPTAPRNAGRHQKIGFDRFEHGIVKRRVVEGQTEEDDAWRVGHPVVFPNILRSGTGFQYRVPVDDTHTYHLIYQVYQTGLPIPPQAAVPVYEIPLLDADGKYMNEILLVQDFFAWASQGPIARRELERLGQSDIGIIMYRELLNEQIEAVERGEDPLEVYRDPERNRCIDIPQEAIAATYTSRTAMAMSGRIALGSAYERFSPMRAQLLALYQEAEARIARGEPVLGIPETPPVPVGAHHKQVTILPER